MNLQEVFLTPNHLGIALEYADGGDLSEYIDNQAQLGVRVRQCLLHTAWQHALPHLLS